MMEKNIKKAIHHYFLPHESNNYKARALHSSSIIFYILLILGFQLFIGTLKKVRPEILGFATDITVEQVLLRVNGKRKEVNLPPLTLSKELSDAATKKASDMFAKNYWAHISPTGTTPWTFITDSGYQYLYAGENLAKDFYVSDEVVEAWMRSPTHRANILKAEYTDIGLAVMNGRLNGEDTTLVVQEFGSKMAVQKQVDNKQKDLAFGNLAQVTPYSEQIEAGNQKSNISSNENVPAGVVKIKPMIIWPQISRTLSLTLTEFLLIILFVDSLYMWKNKTIRVSGHSLAHIIFLGALIGAMGATGIGVIL